MYNSNAKWHLKLQPARLNHNQFRLATTWSRQLNLHSFITCTRSLILFLPRSHHMRPSHLRWPLPLFIRTRKCGCSNALNMVGNLAYLEQSKSIERHAPRRRLPRCTFPRRRPWTSLPLQRQRSRRNHRDFNLRTRRLRCQRLSFRCHYTSRLQSRHNRSFTRPCKSPWRKSALNQFEFNRKQSKYNPTTRQTPQRPRRRSRQKTARQ